MIQYSKLKDINTNLEEGKILMAALAILTSIDDKHINIGRWGSSLHPDKCVEQLVELANEIYYEEELKRENLIKCRDEKINKILRIT